MMARLVTRHPLVLITLLRLSLVVILLAGQLNPVLIPSAAAVPSAGGLQTIGDFLSLGANTMRELQTAIDMAGDELMGDTLEQLYNDIDTIIETLSRTYQHNLDVTINSLNAFTRNKLLELQRLIDQVNQKLQEDIMLVSREAQNVIRQASLEIRRATLELEQSLKNVIIVSGETAAYVVDRAIYDAILVVALVLLGLGLLLFIWLLFSRRLPGGFARLLLLLFMAAYLALFGAMVLLPPVRGYAMAYTGVGLEQRLEKVANEPRIFDVFPHTIILGQTPELEVWGSTLRPEGKSPTAKIAGLPVTVTASSDQRVVVNVADLTAPEGSHNLILIYDGREGAREVVNVSHLTPTPAPPDLVVFGLHIDPSSPVVGDNAHAIIWVRNRGSGPARRFEVELRPYAGHPGLTTEVPVLNATQSQSFAFDFAYPNPGNFDAVAIADVSNSVPETNEANNSRTLRVTVQPPPPRQARVTVNFIKILVEKDTEAGGGEMWLDFTIGGETGRWPLKGFNEVKRGNEYTIGKVFVLTLTEGEILKIYVNGTEADRYVNDPMGYVDRKFLSTDEWGKGPQEDQSSCPAGCYTIWYEISVTWLQ